MIKPILNLDISWLVFRIYNRCYVQYESKVLTQGSELLIATEHITFPGAIFCLVRVSLNVLPDRMQIIPEHKLKTKLISTSKTEQL